MKFTLLSILLLFTATLSADIVVIGNLQNNNPVMSARAVQEIYMGRRRTLADNTIAHPIDNRILREQFYQYLTARPIEQINAYWARLKFSGHGAPPEISPDTEEVIRIIKANKNAIAYIDRKDLKESDVRILFTLEINNGKDKN